MTITFFLIPLAAFVTTITKLKFITYEINISVVHLLGFIKENTEIKQ
jgi:hypothetical protein